MKERLLRSRNGEVDPQGKDTLAEPDTDLASRLAKRWKLLQFLGGALMIISLVLNWDRSADVRR